LHYTGSLVEATPWSIVQSQVVLSAAAQQVLLMALYL
jgi:hypothetical protein